MIQPASITISIEVEKLLKLKKIIKDLFESNSLNSDEIEEFIKFTLFIVFDEYKRDVPSLKKFYSMNLAKYLENRDGRSQTKP
ncbi:MAG: hypothetical protein M3Q77_03565 [Thermoproteota archaeon]|nr:hypothetical protein [Nitrosopumilus sp.]MDQ3083875.1 hypothetical protein [Thermoproteota archaeon]